MHYLLDACSLLTIFNGESGAQKVIDLLEQAKAGAICLSMNIVQLLEVYYDRIYISGEGEARAKILSATLITKDKEMKAAEEAGEFSILWLK